MSRSVEHYNLDVIISVGYCVKSHRGVLLQILQQLPTAENTSDVVY